MKKYILCILTLIFVSNFSLVSNEIKLKTIKKLNVIISSYILVSDSRPLHYDNTKNVSLRFLKAFQNQFIYKKESLHEELMEAFAILYVNSHGIFEDGSDLYYSTMNRSLCFAIISLLAGNYSAVD